MTQPLAWLRAGPYWHGCMGIATHANSTATRTRLPRPSFTVCRGGMRLIFAGTVAGLNNGFEIGKSGGMRSVAHACLLMRYRAAVHATLPRVPVMDATIGFC